MSSPETPDREPSRLMQAAKFTGNVLKHLFAPYGATHPAALPEPPYIIKKWQEDAPEREHVNKYDPEIERQFAAKIQAVNEGSDFSIDDFMETRVSQSTLTVELGPGNYPTLLRSMKSPRAKETKYKAKTYTDGSAYIGIDNMSNLDFSEVTDLRFADIIYERPGEKISLITDRLLGRKRFEDSDNTIVDEAYDPFFGTIKTSFAIYYGHAISDKDLTQSRLPDTTNANEVIASYVFDDRHADDELVAAEAARLLAEGGYFVVSDRLQNIDRIRAAIQGAGLVPVFAGETNEYKKIKSDAINAANAMGLTHNDCDLLLIAQKPFK